MRVLVETPDGTTTLEGHVRPDADLDGVFTLDCVDDGRTYIVYGWQVDVDVLDF